MKNNETNKIAVQIAGRLTEIRRAIHKHPELGFQEKRTSSKIIATLRGIGLDKVLSPVGGTGVVGLLTGKKGPGRTIAFRADMDALPVQEENDVPYKSRVPGKMHACGHDAHVTMLLGAAMILKRLQNELSGQVKFIFQPAEEGLHGAEGMIKAGVLRTPNVDVIFALHVDPEVELGTVACAPGPVWAAADSFEIEVIGRGGHGAFHHKCVDPIMVANQIYTGLESIQRNLPGTAARVISVCSIHGGTAFNIVPDRVTLQGTVRTFDKTVQETIIRRMREVSRGIAAAHGAKASVNYKKLQPAVINDAKAGALLCLAAKESGLKTIPSTPRMGGEDFTFYLKHVPGVMANIGIRAGKDRPGWHNCRFDIDERVLPLGAALLAKCALAMHV